MLTNAATLWCDVTSDMWEGDGVQDMNVFVCCESLLFAHEGSEAITADASPNAHHSPTACCYLLHILSPKPIVRTNTMKKKKSL